MILIVGSADDAHVDAVRSMLDARGISSCIIDPFDPSCSGLSLNGAEDLGLSDLDVSFGSARAFADEISAVWWRLKPAFKIEAYSPAVLYDQQFAIGEWAHALSALDSLHNLLWVNPREAQALASRKPHQLRTALRCRLKVPETLISNSAPVIRAFLARHATEGCIYKSLNPYMAPDGRQTYTTRLDASRFEEMVDLAGVCPGIYQTYVRSRFELRITVVGADIYTARISKRDLDSPDWRRDIEDDIYDRCELDPRQVEQIMRLHRAFKLQFGAYDFIVGDEGDLIFLEVNPSGQWLWLEERLQLPISARLAELLAST